MDVPHCWTCAWGESDASIYGDESRDPPPSVRRQTCESTVQCTQCPHFFPTRHMADHSPPTRFRSLFGSALADYEKKTGITLAGHPLAKQLQSCHSIESTTALLQGQAQAFTKLRGRDRAIKSIKNTLSILTTLSDTTLGDSIGLVRHNVLVAYSTTLTGFLQPFPPAKAIHAGLAILLDVCTTFQYLCGYHCDTM